MSHLRRLLPSRAMAVALLAVFLAVGGRSAYAAANSFLLNTTNTSSAQTTLNGSAVNGPALQLTNTSKNKSATALALNVASSNPPFTVNSTKKVAKLNADKLDGIDSKGFVQGSEHAVANRVSLTVPVGQNTPATVLSLPGLGTLSVNCSDLSNPVNSTNETYLSFNNTSGQPLDVDRVETYFMDPVFTPSGVLEGLAETVVADGAADATNFSAVLSSGETSFSHVQYQVGTGAGASSQLTTIIATATMPYGSATCVASAQAVTMP